MKQIIYFLLFFMIFSCTKEEEKPKNLIPKQKMINLLFDMHLASKSRNIRTISKEKNPNYYPLIYDKYQVDSTQFKESHTYYLKNIELYQEIYTKLEDSISKLTKKQQKLVKEADSIKKLNQKLIKKTVKKSNLKDIKKVKKDIKFKNN